jgi:hypothetical protein
MIWLVGLLLKRAHKESRSNDGAQTAVQLGTVPRATMPNAGQTPEDSSTKG